MPPPLILRFLLSFYFLYLFILYLCLLYSIKYRLCLPGFVASESKLLKQILYTSEVFSQNKFYFYKLMTSFFPFFFFFYQSVFFFFPFRYMNVFFNVNFRYKNLQFVLFSNIIVFISHYVSFIRKRIPIFTLRKSSNSKPHFLLCHILKINNSSKNAIISN